MTSRKIITYDYFGQLITNRAKAIRRLVITSNYPSLIRLTMKDAKAEATVQKIDRAAINNHWKKMGKYFGYPDCCIKAFCELPLDQRTQDQIAVMRNQLGFVPCPEHAKQVADGEVLLENLINNRKHKQPFPIDF